MIKIEVELRDEKFYYKAHTGKDEYIEGNQSISGASLTMFLELMKSFNSNMTLLQDRELEEAKKNLIIETYKRSLNGENKEGE